ncbi:MAG TPA: proline racemase family protein, partial [Isosphaeraceae bacterium]
PSDPSCAAGVIFFNNVSYLNMCGHGTIGLLVTLAHMGRIEAGTHRIETPVGVVTATLNGPNDVTVRNVPSYRLEKGVRIDVDGIGTVVGHVAWGGNWFFLVDGHGLELSLANLEALTDYTWRVRRALGRHRITGANGQEIDHIELNGPPSSPEADGRNFVLCPGKAYDRSPCGTGTSAKVACLIADGKLSEGEIWRQESIIGTIFEARGRAADGAIVPEIRGTAYVNGEATLLVQDDDPLAWGIRG